MRKKDSTKEMRSKDRENAINYVRSWAAGETEKYKEPVRAGTPKGDPIGLSSKKYHAALMLTLYPNSLKLKDIAEAEDISHGMIRLWRTEKNFMEAVGNARKGLSDLIIANLKSTPTAKAFFKYLRHLNQNVNAPVLNFLTEQMKKGMGHILALEAMEAFLVDDEKSKKDWGKIPIIKEAISMELDRISSPNAMETYGGEQQLRYAVETLKQFIFQRLGI